MKFKDMDKYIKIRIREITAQLEEIKEFNKYIEGSMKVNRESDKRIEFLIREMKAEMKTLKTEIKSLRNEIKEFKRFPEVKK